MIKHQKTPLLLALILILLSNVIRCSQNTQNQEVQFEEVPLPTPAENLDILIKNISNDDPGVRLVSIRALNKHGGGAVIAIPALKKALHDPVTDVRISALITLGNLGGSADSTVPDLTELLKSDVSHNARIQAARALGRIGSASAIPTLMGSLLLLLMLADGGMRKGDTKSGTTIRVV